MLATLRSSEGHNDSLRADQSQQQWLAEVENGVGDKEVEKDVEV